VRQLQRDGDFGMFANRLNHGPEGGFGFFVPQTKIARCDSARRLDRSRLDHKHARAGNGKLAKVRNVP
jgi:hypothetical protein